MVDCWIGDGVVPSQVGPDILAIVDCRNSFVVIGRDAVILSKKHWISCRVQLVFFSMSVVGLLGVVVIKVALVAIAFAFT
jgi:hypothetical protein